MNLRASTKSAVRCALRRLGYDFAPLAAGMTNLQRQLLARTPVAVDVGANVGQYAERLRDIGYAGRILSFEPGTRAFRTLAAKAAKDPRWAVRHCALGERPGRGDLRLSANSVSSSLLDVADEHLRAAPKSRTVAHEEVEVSTLDEQLQSETRAPLWLKLDVQGSELAVLRGAMKSLGRTLAVQTEVSFGHLYDNQTDWLALCGFLQESGFVLRYIEPGLEDRGAGHMLQADFLFVRI